jgi:hypothetical protein
MATNHRSSKEEAPAVGSSRVAAAVAAAVANAKSLRSTTNAPAGLAAVATAPNSQQVQFVARSGTQQGTTTGPAQQVSSVGVSQDPGMPRPGGGVQHAGPTPMVVPTINGCASNGLVPVPGAIMVGGGGILPVPDSVVAAAAGGGGGGGHALTEQPALRSSLLFPTLPPQKRKMKMKRNCEACTRAKVKCDGEQPCMRCINRGQTTGCRFLHKKSRWDNGMDGDDGVLRTVWLPCCVGTGRACRGRACLASKFLTINVFV